MKSRDEPEQKMPTQVDSKLKNQTDSVINWDEIDFTDSPDDLDSDEINFDEPGDEAYGAYRDSDSSGLNTDINAMSDDVFEEFMRSRPQTPYIKTTGLDRFPLVKQTDAFSCGAVSFRMFLNYLEFLPGLSVQEICKLTGTNPLTGTTEKEMFKGFEALGLTFTRPRANSTDDLRKVIADGNVVFLRTMLPGGFKHWVLLHGFKGQDFLGSCPGAGAIQWSDDFTHRVWSARDYDHFVSPLDRTLHPKAIQREKDNFVRGWKPVFEQTLAEFLGGWPVVPDNKLAQFHHDMINHAIRDIHLMAQNNRGVEFAYPAREDFIFKAVDRQGMSNNMLVLERSTGRVAGGVSWGLRWVEPEFRGTGLGAEITLASYSDPEKRFLFPNSYSEAGYYSRVSAHRLAITRALADGLTVPPAVLEDYNRKIPHHSQFSAEALKEARKESARNLNGNQLKLF